MKIEVQFSQDGLFGSADVEDYDIAASMKQFTTDLYGRLHQLYPSASIEVNAGNDDWHKVDGQTDSDEAVLVGDDIHDLWEDWEWVIYKQTPTPPDPLVQAKAFCTEAIGRDYRGATSASNLAIAYATIALVEGLRAMQKKGVTIWRGEA